jgi:hypothetical protein
MQFEINDSPMTTEELRANYGDAIVGVKYVLDSNDDGPAVLEVTVQQTYSMVLRYLGMNGKWYLQAVSIDASEYRKPPREGVLDDSFAMIDAANTPVKARGSR